MGAQIIQHPNSDVKAVDKKSARFWMKHDVKAFLLETAAVDAEGCGALILARGYYFMTGALPKSDAELAKVCRLPKRKFDRLKPWLLSFFNADGRSEELDATIAETERIIASRRAAGRLGGAGKAVAFARQKPKQNPTQSESHSETDSEPTPPPLPSEPRARESEAAEITAEVLGALPTSARAHPGWLGLGRWIEALLSEGTAGLDIVVGISQALRSLADTPPSSFEYFRSPIERACSTRLAVLPKASAPVSASTIERYVEKELGLCKGQLAERVAREQIDEWHRRFVAGESMPRIVEEAREAIAQP